MAKWCSNARWSAISPPLNDTVADAADALLNRATVIPHAQR
jgi:hypothetical protein